MTHMRILSIKGFYAIILMLTGLHLAGSPSLALPPPHAKIAILTQGLTFAPVHLGLKEGMARLGYREGDNITYIIEDMRGSTADLPLRMEKLLAAGPDAVFSVTSILTGAAKKATAKVPIVFAWVSDPVEAGLIASFASSQNNLTGVASLSATLTGKRLEVLLELAPKAKKIFLLESSAPSAGHMELPFLAASAQKMNVQLMRRVVANRQEIESALKEISPKNVDGIFFIPSALVRTNIDLLIKKGLHEKIPLMVQEETLVAQGALASYGPDTRLVGSQAAAILDRVLKGTRPSAIMVETPQKLFLSVNMKTANEIGLNLSPSLLERVDRLIGNQVK